MRWPILVSRRLADSLDYLVVIIAWVVMSAPWLVGTRFTTGDNIGFFFPVTYFVVFSLLHGDPPWWNPLEYGGQPLLGDPQSMIFTPHTLVGLLAGRAFNLRVFDVTTLFCLLLGGIATLIIGKNYSKEKFLPILGSLVFMMGGVAASRLQHVSQIVSYSIVPIQMLVLRWLCSEPGWKAATVLIFSLLPSLLNPNQVVVLSILAQAPFFLMFLSGSRNPLKALFFAVNASVAAMILAMPVLACVREFFLISNRPSLPIGASTGFSFSLFNLAGLILPGLYGISKISHGLWPPTDCSEDYIYIGLIPIFVILSVLLRPLRTSRLSVLAASSAVFWWLFSLGVHGSLYPMLFHFIPGMQGLRRPADAAFLMNVTMSIAIASATFKSPGVRCAWAENLWSAFIILATAFLSFKVSHQILAYAESRRHLPDLLWSVRQLGLRATVLALAAVCVLTVRKAFRRRLATTLAIILAVVDMMKSGRFSPIFVAPYEQSESAQFYRQPTALIPSKGSPGEALSYVAELEGDDRRQNRMETLGGVLAANLPMAAGFSMTQGYNPLSLDNYNSSVGTQNLQGEAKTFTASAPDYESEIYRRLSLRFVLIPTYTLGNATSAGGMTNIGIRAALTADTKARLRTTINEYEVWELTSWLPKATLLSVKNADNDACHVLKYKNDFIRIGCSSKAPAHLIVGDNFAPGWSACVNDVPAPVTSYLGLFRQIPIGVGQSIITMRYQPIPFFRTKHC